MWSRSLGPDPRSWLCRAALALALVLAACSGPEVGDACESDDDCGDELSCVPGGFCSRLDCVNAGCPDEAVCARPTPDGSLCLPLCESSDDCNDGWSCIVYYTPNDEKVCVRSGSQ